MRFSGGVIDGTRTRKEEPFHRGHNPAHQTHRCLDHSTP